MPIPNLLHPVPIIIRLIEQAETFFDEDTREPVQMMARKPTVTLDAQVRWPRSKDADPSMAGRVDESRGYVLLRKIDLDNASVSISIGDNIIKVGTIDHDLYVNELEPLGHYGDQGGHTMLKCYFNDRSPSRVPP